jgi:TetR/AcrR family transcriptional repressor of nem operon
LQTAVDGGTTTGISPDSLALSCYRGHSLERITRDVMAMHFHPVPARRQPLFTGRLALGLAPFPDSQVPDNNGQATILDRPVINWYANNMNAVESNPVGRPRSFDEGRALGAVMDVFWNKGYEATSMADLMAATGLHKGSLYQAFGGKHSLFVRALSEYVVQLAGNMKHCLTGAARGIDGLRDSMYCQIDLSVNDDGSSNGCMALNTLVETAQHDPEVMNVLKGAFKMRLELIGEAVVRAQSEGDLRQDLSSERMTLMLATFEAGLMAEIKGPLGREEAKELVDDFLASMA